MLSAQAVRGLPRLRAPGIVPCIIAFYRQLPALADLGGVIRVTSHPPGAAAYFMLFIYCACDLSYFDVVLCPSWSQILATPLHQEVTFSSYTEQHNYFSLN